MTAATLADKGHDVVCMDVDKTKVAQLQKGVMPIYEPGLDKMIQRNMHKGKERIVFSSSLSNAMAGKDIVFICVGTPSNEDGTTNLSYVEDVAINIAKALTTHTIIVIKSTVPVGTTEKVRNLVQAHKNKNVTFEIVFNPEFLREGKALEDIANADRIVIGSESLNAQQTMMELYEPFMSRMVLTDIASAELIKLASNAFLATKISFINSIAHVCDLTGANVEDVARGMGFDSRISPHFLNAGIGYGGSCFPKDIDNLITQSDSLGYDFQILKAVKQVNDNQLVEFIDLIKEKLGGFEGKTVGILGLSFKPDTDDLRDSKSLEIVKAVLAGGGQIKAHDPISAAAVKRLYPSVTACISAYEVAFKADAVVIATEDPAFAKLDFSQVTKYMNTPRVFDGRNMMDPFEMKQKGFEYYSIGRPTK